MRAALAAVVAVVGLVAAPSDENLNGPYLVSPTPHKSDQPPWASSYVRASPVSLLSAADESSAAL